MSPFHIFLRHHHYKRGRVPMILFLTILLFFTGCTQRLYDYHRSLTNCPFLEFQRCQEPDPYWDWCTIEQVLKEAPTGIYQGVITKNNRQYHAFVFPHALEETGRGSLEVFVPVQRKYGDAVLLSETHELPQNGIPAVIYIDECPTDRRERFFRTAGFLHDYPKIERDYVERSTQEAEFSSLLLVLCSDFIGDANAFILNIEKRYIFLKSFTSHKQDISWEVYETKECLEGCPNNYALVILTSPGYLVTVPVDVLGGAVVYIGFYLCLLLGICNLD